MKKVSGAGVMWAMVVGWMLSGLLLMALSSDSSVSAASGETSDNCEVFATINGVDKYRCDDFDYEVVCYGEINGMMWCLPKM